LGKPLVRVRQPDRPHLARIQPNAAAHRDVLRSGRLDGSGSRLDPEGMRDISSAYDECVAETTAQYDGFVAKYMGDGVLVYFGYPRAHEDDAERAVRAGLDLIDAVGRLDVKSVKLQARVGIATGLVVVGDPIGKGSTQEQSVVGETTNLAARLQTLAEPDAVVIAAGTRRLNKETDRARRVAGNTQGMHTVGSMVLSRRRTNRFAAPCGGLRPRRRVVKPMMSISPVQPGPFAGAVVSGGGRNSDHPIGRSSSGSLTLQPRIGFCRRDIPRS